MRSNIRLAGVALVLAVPSGAAADLSRDGEALVTFSAEGPAGLMIEGKTSEIEVSESGGVVKMVVPLGGLTTGIGLRDRHMRDRYLEVAKFPRAELTFERARIDFPAHGVATTTSMVAKLLLHGQSRPVEVSYTVRSSGSKYVVNAKVRIDLTNFGITVPSYLGVTVRRQVDITAALTVADVGRTLSRDGTLGGFQTSGRPPVSEAHLRRRLGHRP